MTQTDCAIFSPQTTQDLGAAAQTLRLIVRIAEDHRDRFPSAQFLDRKDIDAGLNEPRGKGMPEIMEPEPRDPCLAHRRIERPQQIARIPWVARAVDEDVGRAANLQFAARTNSIRVRTDRLNDPHTHWSSMSVSRN
jgi:hypothetical protein